MFSLSCYLFSNNRFPTLTLSCNWRRKKNLENFISVKQRKAKDAPTAKDHSYNLLGNHTHRIAEAVNLAPEGGKGKGRQSGARGEGGETRERKPLRQQAGGRSQETLGRNWLRPPNFSGPEPRPPHPHRRSAALADTSPGGSGSHGRQVSSSVWGPGPEQPPRASSVPLACMRSRSAQGSPRGGGGGEGGTGSPAGAQARNSRALRLSSSQGTLP